MENFKTYEQFINESIFDSLEKSGKLTSPSGGRSLVGKSYTLNGGSEYDNIFFEYKKDSRKPFGVKVIVGHHLSPKILGSYGFIRGHSTGTAGVDKFFIDGNYNPKWFSEKDFLKILDHFSKGFSSYSKSFSDFYKGRTPD